MAGVTATLVGRVEEVDQSRMNLVAGLKASGFSVDLLERTTLEARRGSQAAIRIKGGFIARDEEFPIVLCVRWESIDSPSNVSIAVYSEFVGPLTGVRKKYQRICDEAAQFAAKRLAS